MTHDERVVLINKPFPVVTRVHPKKSWGGINVGNAGQVPTEGHSVWPTGGRMYDESYLRYGRNDDEAQGD